MNEFKKNIPDLRCIVVIGATSAIALQCLYLWLQASPAQVFLLGRNPQKLKRVHDDLQARFPKSSFKYKALDFLDSDTIDSTALEICNDKFPELVMIAHGSLPNQMQCQQNLALCHEVMLINGISPALWAEAFTKNLENTSKPAKIVVIGSVAGDRGRQSNYTYGAAKCLVERYIQGLQHRLALAKSALKISLVKPGPTATPMTAHLRDLERNMASVEDVAATIVNGVSKGSPLIYAPGKWFFIMTIIRHIPDFIFNKIKI